MTIILFCLVFLSDGYSYFSEFYDLHYLMILNLNVDLCNLKFILFSGVKCFRDLTFLSSYANVIWVQVS